MRELKQYESRKQQLHKKDKEKFQKKNLTSAQLAAAVAWSAAGLSPDSAGSVTGSSRAEEQHPPASAEPSRSARAPGPFCVLDKTKQCKVAAVL